MFELTWECSNCGHLHNSVHVKEWWKSGVMPLFCPHCLTEQKRNVKYELNEYRKMQIESCFEDSPKHAFANFIGASLFGIASHDEIDEAEHGEDT